MGGQTAGNEKHICTGLFAHVDAGKTTLSEAMLYQSGALRRLGRVDHQDAFLDTDHMERERGITIFSKQAELSLPWGTMTLLDTPGHVDFSTEAERTLRVLDCALLVISGTDGAVAAAGALRCAGFYLCEQDGPGRGEARSLAGGSEAILGRCLCGLDHTPLGGGGRCV